MDKLGIITAILNAGETPVESDVFQPFDIGCNYLIRTVTHIQTGRVVAVGATEIVLEDAAWIADTGRFADALENTEFSEVEPFPAGRRVIVGRGAVVDAVQVVTLPRSQK